MMSEPTEPTQDEAVIPDPDWWVLPNGDIVRRSQVAAVSAFDYGSRIGLCWTLVSGLESQIVTGVLDGYTLEDAQRELGLANDV